MRTFFKSRRLPTCGVIAAFLLVFSGSAHSQHEFVVFPSAEGQKKVSVSDESIDTTEAILAADFLYSYTNNRFRFLGEYLLGNEEQELERLLLGWEFDEQSMIWIGRFHSLLNYWNTSFHHGQYLQTSISRPGIDNFEDQGGVLPGHIAGVLLQTGVSMRQSRVDIRLSTGRGPKLTSDGFEPADLLNFEDSSDKHGLSSALRLAYQPDFLGENKFGITLGYSDIFVEDDVVSSLPELHEFDQIVVGMFVDWQLSDWRIISSINKVRNDIEALESRRESFVAGYFHAEYELSDRWTFYGRLEDSSGTGDSVYLELFPDFASAKILAGARYDFLKRHALTIEIADVETRQDDFGEIRFQWSFFLP